MEYHEVAVVGGGPAGSTCATELAKNGVDVVLFDHSHPREKLCGGAISGRHLKLKNSFIYLFIILTHYTSYECYYKTYYKTYY